jgi:hypothetical protein
LSAVTGIGEAFANEAVDLGLRVRTQSWLGARGWLELDD